ERAGAPFSMGMMLAPQRRRDWNYAIWPCGVGLVLWKMCIVSYRLGARRGYLCLKCGYDRRGLARGAACPECGGK
ncbi:MAG TPA: hypothetical protein VD997_04245, partial [Phycisphaerales bacterium]|nr:hypothetical protein [Phycisphaerales bacterium]